MKLSIGNKFFCNGVTLHCGKNREGDYFTIIGITYSDYSIIDIRWNSDKISGKVLTRPFDNLIKDRLLIPFDSDKELIELILKMG